MCPPNYDQSAKDPMVTHALGHMMYGYTLLVPMNQRVLNKPSKEHNKIYYAHLTSVGFEHSVCHESLLTSFIMLLAWLVEHSLVHWYQQCVTTVHHIYIYIYIYIYVKKKMKNNEIMRFMKQEKLSGKGN